MMMMMMMMTCVGAACQTDSDCAKFTEDQSSKLCCQDVRRGRQGIRRQCDQDVRRGRQGIRRQCDPGREPWSPGNSSPV